MEALLKMLFTKAMYENSDITEIRSLTDLYQTGFVRELFEILENAWRESIPLTEANGKTSSQVRK